MADCTGGLGRVGTEHQCSHGLYRPPDASSVQSAMCPQSANMYREVMEDFIGIYESEPCLWQIKHKDYHERAKKEAAYARLVDKLKVIDPKNACKDSVVKKINNIRSSYRKECKKVEASIRSGTGEVYEPKLWYFKMLRFLDNQGTSRSSSRLKSSDSINSYNEEYDEDEESQDDSCIIEEETKFCESQFWQENVREDAECSGQSVPEVSPERPPLNKKRCLEPREESNGVPLADKEPRTGEDRFDVFGKIVAMKLRGLPKKEMLIAEKNINDALFQAEMSC